MNEKTGTTLTKPILKNSQRPTVRRLQGSNSTSSVPSTSNLPRLKDAFNQFCNLISQFTVLEGSEFSGASIFNTKMPKLKSTFNDFYTSALKNAALMPSLQKNQSNEFAFKELKTEAYDFINTWKLFELEVSKIKEKSRSSAMLTIESNIQSITSCLEYIQFSCTQNLVNQRSASRTCQLLTNQFAEIQKSYRKLQESENFEECKNLIEPVTLFTRDCNNAFLHDFANVNIMPSELSAMRSRIFQSSSEIIRRCNGFSSSTKNIAEIVNQLTKTKRIIASVFKNLNITEVAQKLDQYFSPSMSLIDILNESTNLIDNLFYSRSSIIDYLEFLKVKAVELTDANTDLTKQVEIGKSQKDIMVAETLKLKSLIPQNNHQKLVADLIEVIKENKMPTEEEEEEDYTDDDFLIESIKGIIVELNDDIDACCDILACEPDESLTDCCHRKMNEIEELQKMKEAPNLQPIIEYLCCVVKPEQSPVDAILDGIKSRIQTYEWQLNQKRGDANYGKFLDLLLDLLPNDGTESENKKDVALSRINTLIEQNKSLKDTQQVERNNSNNNIHDEDIQVPKLKEIAALLGKPSNFENIDDILSFITNSIKDLKNKYRTCFDEVQQVKNYIISVLERNMINLPSQSITALFAVENYVNHSISLNNIREIFSTNNEVDLSLIDRQISTFLSKVNKKLVKTAASITLMKSFAPILSSLFAHFSEGNTVSQADARHYINDAVTQLKAAQTRSDVNTNAGKSVLMILDRFNQLILSLVVLIGNIDAPDEQFNNFVSNMQH